jgi:hypothetical protein
VIAGPEQAADWQPRRRRRPRAAVLLAIAAVLNAGAGIALGIAVTPDDPPAQSTSPPPAPDVVSVGDLRLQLPQGWRPLAAAPSLPGFDGMERVAAHGPSADLILTTLRPENPALLPHDLYDQAGGVLPTPKQVEIDGREALRYEDLAHGEADVFVVPTTAGVVSVACVSNSSVALAHGCDAPLARLRIGRAAPIPADERAAFAIALPAAVADLNRARAGGRRALAQRRTAAGRARVSRQLAAAYRLAARRMAPLAGELPSTTRVVGLLSGLGDDHAALAAASARRAPAPARAANTRIRAAERRLAAALARWTGPSDAR